MVGQLVHMGGGGDSGLEVVGWLGPTGDGGWGQVWWVVG